MAANLVSVITRKTITHDEIVHIPSGYHYLLGGDFRQNPEHPSLIKMWACLPLVVIGPQPASFARPAGHDYARFTIASSLEFWRTNRASFEKIIFWARVPMILLTLVLGFVIFVVAREFFGNIAGVFAVGLFTFEPTMLAHGRIVHTDIAASLAYLLFFFALFKFLQKIDLPRTLYLGFATAFALLAKFSMIIVVPLLLIALAYVFLRAPKLRTSRKNVLVYAALTILIPVIAINCAYYFQHTGLAKPELDWLRANISELGRLGVRTLSIPLPTYYVFGFFAVLSHNSVGHQTALLGRYGNDGFWYYFPVAFALKTTIPFLLVSIASLLWAATRFLMKQDRRLLWLLSPVVIYMAISMTSRINIGIRHIAPVFPFLFVLGGGFLAWLVDKYGRTAIVATAIFFGWMVFEVIRTYPNYVPYVNQLSLGKPGWELLSDSNVEWGDDIGELASYLNAKGETRIYAALSGGWGTMDMYGITVVDIPPADLRRAPSRYVAIGAGHLNGSTAPGGFKLDGTPLTEDERRQYFANYRKEVPEAVFGNSIYLYRKKETR